MRNAKQVSFALIEGEEWMALIPKVELKQEKKVVSARLDEERSPCSSAL